MPMRTLDQHLSVVVVPIQSLKSQSSTSYLGSQYFAQVATLDAIDAHEYLNSPPKVDDFISFSSTPYYLDDSPPPLLPCYDGSDDSDDSDIHVQEELPIRVWSR